MATLIGILITLYIIGRLNQPRPTQRQDSDTQSAEAAVPSSELVQSYIKSDEHDTELDPICGCYVDTTEAVTRSWFGEISYFCSDECAEKFSVKHPA